MSNSKISALATATTVAGTEVLPIVQSSATVQVSVANLTPGLATITAAKGGTGQTSYAVGDLLYANSTTTLSKLADVATGNALISGGVTTAPAWGKVGLTTHVSGVLPTANGGTGSSTAPVFRAYRNGTQSISSGTFTKVELNAENFDTAGAFDSTTNYRFQPTQSGYYQFNGAVNIAPSIAPTRLLAFIYKTGAAYAQGQDFNSIPGSGGTSTVSTIVYLDGSTDYVELWTFIIAATAAVGGGDVYTYLDGVYVRAA